MNSCVLSKVAWSVSVVREWVGASSSHSDQVSVVGSPGCCGCAGVDCIVVFRVCLFDRCVCGGDGRRPRHDGVLMCLMFARLVVVVVQALIA